MSEDPSHPDYWLVRWSENRIGFHREAVGHALSELGPSVLEGSTEQSVQRATSESVLVPLCGKSHDLVALESMGHTVHGVEVAERAAIDFHQEQGRAFGIDFPSGHPVYRSGRIHLHVADFFDTTPEDFRRPLSRWYDRAALIAFPPETRKRYAAHLESLLAPNARGLVITLEYSDKEMTGPPFSVPHSELVSLFPKQTITEVLRRDVLDDEARWREKGLTKFEEVAYRFE